MIILLIETDFKYCTCFEIWIVCNFISHHFICLITRPTADTRIPFLTSFTMFTCNTRATESQRITRLFMETPDQRLTDSCHADHSEPHLIQFVQDESRRVVHVILWAVTHTNITNHSVKDKESIQGRIYLQRKMKVLRKINVLFVNNFLLQFFF